MRLPRLAAVALFALAACGRPEARAPRPAPAAAALPAGERRIAVSDGTRLYVKVSGKGPVCLLVHGGPGQGTRSTEKMGADALESFLTMVYVDQRGSGLSPDAENYRLERVVQDLDDVRRALGVDKVCLIAHSFGGLLAVNYAHRHPGHVSRLVLSNAILQFGSPANQRMQIDYVNRALEAEGRDKVPLAADADEASLQQAHQEARRRLNETPYAYTLLTPFQSSIEEMQRVDAYTRSRSFGRAVMGGRQTLPEYYRDYAPLSASIGHPTLVLTGSRDYAVGPDEYKRFRFPRQTTVVLDTGHMPYYDDKADFVDAVRAFLVGASP